MRPPLSSHFLFIVAPIHTSDFRLPAQRGRPPLCSESRATPTPSITASFPPPPPLSRRDLSIGRSSPSAPRVHLVSASRYSDVLSWPLRPFLPGPKSPRRTDSTSESFLALQMVTLTPFDAPSYAFSTVLYGATCACGSPLPFH